MYFQGTIAIDLQGTEVTLKPPDSFFGGIANLMSKGSWSERYQQETFKLMALVQSINRVLRESGVDNVVRIAIGSTVIYEDSKNVPNDFALAIASLQSQLEQGLVLRDLEQFDLILEHDDGVIHYVIDFDIYRKHSPGVDPIVIKITGLSAELKREPGESKKSLRKRTEDFFADQSTFDAFQDRLFGRFKDFLTTLEKGFHHRLGVENISVTSRTCVVNMQTTDDPKYWVEYTEYDSPFYGFHHVYDLSYLTMWHVMLSDFDLTMDEFTYVEPEGRVLAEVTDTEWTSSEFDQFEPAATSGAGAEAGIASGTDSVIRDDSGGGGGGGWLDSVSSFFSDAGDASGGFDGGGDTGGGCGGCGGGGCGGS